MRAVFTVEIPGKGVAQFPNNEEFLTRIRSLGWEDMKTKMLPDDEKQKAYQEQAEKLWASMPEIAQNEKDYVVFYGVLLDNQTKFIITRVTESQATFRLLHPKLAKLQSSTETMIRKLITSHSGEPALSISNNEIAVYEKGDAEIIIEGRVITNPFAESVRVDQKNLLLAGAGFLLTVPSLLSLLYISSATSRIIGGTLERLSTAFLSTTVVSVIGFLQTYIQIKNIRLIDWNVASIEKKKSGAR